MDETFFITIQAAIRELERVIGAPDRFFVSLLQESDWTFVVKLHTLFESAVTHHIVLELKRPELREFVSRLDMSSDVGSKLAIAKALNIMPTHDRGLIRLLSSARNNIVHNVDSHPFSLEKFICGLPKQKHDEYVKNVSVAWSDPVKIGDYSVSKATYVRENPKTCFWFRGISVLLNIYIHHYMSGLEQKQAELANALLRHVEQSNKKIDRRDETK
jgi:hypothetical protein